MLRVCVFAAGCGCVFVRLGVCVYSAGVCMFSRVYVLTRCVMCSQGPMGPQGKPGVQVKTHTHSHTPIHTRAHTHTYAHTFFTNTHIHKYSHRYLHILVQRNLRNPRRELWTQLIKTECSETASSCVSTRHLQSGP